MSVDLTLFERIGNRDHGSLDNNNVKSPLLLTTSETNQLLPRSLSLGTAQLISSSSSCEGSCSLSSNDSSHSYSDAAPESHSISFLVSDSPRNIPNGVCKRKRVSQNDNACPPKKIPRAIMELSAHNSMGKVTCEPTRQKRIGKLKPSPPSNAFCSSSNLRRRKTKIMGESIAAREPLQSSDWDGSDWILPCPKLSSVDKGREDEIDTSSLKGEAIDKCSKHGKVRDITTLTGSLDAERTVWKDIDWNLPSLSYVAKKRRLKDITTISKENDTIVSRLGYISTNEKDGIKDDYPTRCEIEIGLENYDSKESTTSKMNDLSNNRLNNISNTQDTTTQEKYHSHIPFIPDVATRFIKNKHFGTHRLSFIDSPRILYRWLRLRLAAGLVRSSFDFLNRILKKYYDEVKKVVKNVEIHEARDGNLAILVGLRDRLAGIWCVYAHFILEVGCLACSRARKQGRPSWKKTENQNNLVDNSWGGMTNEVENNIDFEDFSNIAFSTLLKARDCPLVGNHPAIGVALGRLIVSSTVLKEMKADCSQVELSRKTISTNIQSAIDVCWDTIKLCQSKRRTDKRYVIYPVSEAVIRSLSNFLLVWDKSNCEKEIQAEVHKGINSTLLLPMNLQNSLPSESLCSNGMIISDKNTVRFLCKELNRWSRLGEKLEVNSRHTIRITPSSNSEISFAAEELPLYSALVPLSDPLNHYKDIASPGKEIIWHW